MQQTTLIHSVTNHVEQRRCEVCENRMFWTRTFDGIYDVAMARCCGHYYQIREKKVSRQQKRPANPLKFFFGCTMAALVVVFASKKI